MFASVGRHVPSARPCSSSDHGPRNARACLRLGGSRDRENPLPRLIPSSPLPAAPAPPSSKPCLTGIQQPHPPRSPLRPRSPRNPSSTAPRLAKSPSRSAGASRPCSRAPARGPPPRHHRVPRQPTTPATPRDIQSLSRPSATLPVCVITPIMPAAARTPVPPHDNTRQPRST